MSRLYGFQNLPGGLIHCAGCPDHSFKMVHTLSTVPFSIKPESHWYVPFDPIITGICSRINIPLSTLILSQLSIGGVGGVVAKNAYIEWSLHIDMLAFD